MSFLGNPLNMATVSCCFPFKANQKGDPSVHHVNAMFHPSSKALTLQNCTPPYTQRSTCTCIFCRMPYIYIIYNTHTHTTHTHTLPHVDTMLGLMLLSKLVHYRAFRDRMALACSNMWYCHYVRWFPGRVECTHPHVHTLLQWFM